MPSQLNQMQLGYDQLQDRLVLTFNTKDLNEYRFWITRNMVKGLWSILMQLLQANEKTRVQQAKESEKISEQIEHEKSQRQSAASKYAQSVSKKPLGDEPLLLYKIMGKALEEGGFRLHLEDPHGRSIEFGGDTNILLGLTQLLRKTVEKSTDWHLEFPS